jgi:hypothetical protein
MISLLEFFVSQWGEEFDTPFVRAFLDGANLLRIQALLTDQLRARIGSPTVPLVEFSEGLLSSLMAFARNFYLGPATPIVIERANASFAESNADANEARFYETAFWKRWCTQGLPDPNNIPLPLVGDKPDFTVETDGYVLNNPIGYAKYPHW